MTTVKQKCHDTRNKVHANLKDLQVLTTKVKKLERLQDLELKIGELLSETKTQIIKDYEDSL